MPTISEPEIVFCEFNHIYDKAIHAVCPYCRQIAEQTDKMKLQMESGQPKVWGFGRKKQDPDGNATTMLSRKWRFSSKNKDPEATEYVAKVKPDDDATVLSSARMSIDDNDATVLIPREQAAPSAPPAREEAALTVSAQEHMQPIPIPLRTGVSDQTSSNPPLILPAVQAPTAVHTPTMVQMPAQEVSRQPVRRVIGWLVCIAGDAEYGRSFELTEGENFIALQPNGSLFCGQQSKPENRMEAVIYRDSATGFFQIQAQGNEAPTMNGIPLSGNCPMQPYSRLTFDALSVVFFPAVGVCGFEWR